MTTGRINQIATRSRQSQRAIPPTKSPGTCSPFCGSGIFSSVKSSNEHECHSLLTFPHTIHARESTPPCRSITTLHLESERGIREVGPIQALPQDQHSRSDLCSLSRTTIHLHDGMRPLHSPSLQTLGQHPRFWPVSERPRGFRGKALGDRRFFATHHLSSFYVFHTQCAPIPRYSLHIRSTLKQINQGTSQTTAFRCLVILATGAL